MSCRRRSTLSIRRCILGVACLACLLATPLVVRGVQPPVAIPPGASMPAELFLIPAAQPETIITAERLEVSSGTATLIGRVKAVRETDLLTAGKVVMGQNPTWLLATLTPRLFRKESILQQQMTRESTLDATNIRWNSASGEIDASDSVVLKVEERTWDLGTYTCVIISADRMRGFRDQKTMTFDGNVKINDQKRFGQGRHLDYFKASSTVVLSGDARVETEEWSEKNKRMEKRTIEGQRIEYRTDTKAMQSE